MKKILLILSFIITNQADCVVDATKKSQKAANSTNEQTNINAKVKRIYGETVGQKIINLQSEIKGLQTKQQIVSNKILKIPKARGLFLDYIDKQIAIVNLDSELDKLLAPKLEQFQGAISVKK